MKIGLGRIVVTLGLASSACLDGSPLIVPEEAGLEDGGQPEDVEIDGDIFSPCRDCFMGLTDADVTCAATWGPCSADPKCAGTLECALLAGCLALPSLPDIVTCGTPCATQAGIFRADDPAVGLILPVLDCVVRECRAVCQ